MRAMLITAGLVTAGLLAYPSRGVAADHEAGVPLTPAEAAGAWTLESGGNSICTLTLGVQKGAQGYGVKGAEGCGEALPGAPTAWQPTADGLKLVSADGQTALGFHRWSNSLFVSRRSSGVDVQLRRGG
jgi:hypothetical protein